MTITIGVRAIPKPALQPFERQLGMLTYRGRDELDTRFGKLLPHLERPPVAEYLDHHGRRFAERFPVKTFLLLSEAIDRASIGDQAAMIHRSMDVLTKFTGKKHGHMGMFPGTLYDVRSCKEHQAPPDTGTHSKFVH